LHLITAPALSRRQTLPTQKKHEAPDVRAAPGAWSVGRGRRLMYLLGAGAVVSGGKRRSATLRNDPIRGRAVEREGDGGRRWRTVWLAGQGIALGIHGVGGAGREAQIAETAQRPYMRSCHRAPTRGADGADGRCGLSVKGLSSTFTEPAVPGGKRKSARARNDPICGPAAERRPEGREGGVDGRSRGCPRPSPGRWCRTASANRPDLATTLYAVLPTRADPVVGSAGRPRGCPGDGGGWPARGPAMTESWGRRHEEERPHDGEERRRRGGPGPPCPTTPHHE